jgi:N-acetylglucosaminyldiphosphoundecaprenol N-acetyl-beta-D-mannosaminyltransferase
MDEATRGVRSTRTQVLGVPVDKVDMDGALACVRRMLEGNRAKTILAVNPEKVIAAQRDAELLQLLQGADLLVPDGIGVVLAARLLGKGPMQRVPGSELMPEICRQAAAEGHRVFLYGAKPEIVTRAAALLQQSYPGLQIAGTQHGYLPEEDMERLIEGINASQAEILFVALGSPRQERWMARHRARLRVKVCQGVGGTFDAICGHPPRAPLLFRKCHLEWFYRLVTQPSRAHRQAALPRFAGQVLREALSRRWRTPRID